MQRDSKIFVAGHRGLVGSAIVSALRAKGYSNLLLKTHSELDLTNYALVEQFFSKNKPEYVILAAAKVGGIVANNTYRADFIYQNLAIQNNVIYQSFLNGVKKLIFLGSTCIYPKNAPQPISEESLLTSELEYTNEPYAIAKIAGLKMCESFNLQYGCNFVALMPTNLYGLNDNFDLQNSHVLPAMLRKMHLAKCLENGDLKAICKNLGILSESEALEKLAEIGVQRDFIEIWGSGNPKREFLHSSDLAQACVFVLENVDFKDLAKGADIRNTHLNVGSGEEISIRDLALLMKDIVGFSGDLRFNTQKPDGTMRKLTDVSKIHSLGWKHKIPLNEGIKELYKWYLTQF